MPPLIITRMGLDAFGIWGLILLINVYTVFLDLGLESSLIKHIADAYTDNDLERINGFFSIAMTVYAIIFCFGLLIAFYGSRFITLLLIRSTDALQYQLIVQLYIVVAFGNLLVIPLASTLKGLQLYDRSNFIEILAAFINALGSITGLVFGWGIMSLLFGVALAMFWRLGVYTYFVRKNLRTLKWRKISTNNLKLLRDLFSLSPADISVRIYSVATQSVIRFALVTYGGLVAVGAYEIAKRVVGQISGMSTTIFTPLLPTVSVLTRQDRQQTLLQLLERSLLYLSIASMPILVFMLLHYDAILQAWLGVEDVQMIALAGRLLLLATCIDLFTGPVTTAAVGMGTARITILKLAGPLILYVTLIPLFGYLYGFTGILVGETVALIVGTLIGLYVFKSWTSIPVLSMAFKYIVQVCLSAIPFALVIWFLWKSSSLWWGWQNLLVWGSVFTGYLLVTAVIFRITGILSSYEINLVAALFQRSTNRANPL